MHVENLDLGGGHESRPALERRPMDGGLGPALRRKGETHWHPWRERAELGHRPEAAARLQQHCGLTQTRRRRHKGQTMAVVAKGGNGLRGDDELVKGRRTTRRVTEGDGGAEQVGGTSDARRLGVCGVQADVHTRRARVDSLEQRVDDVNHDGCRQRR